jgi:hypothetical protein
MKFWLVLERTSSTISLPQVKLDIEIWNDEHRFPVHVESGTVRELRVDGWDWSRIRMAGLFKTCQYYQFSQAKLE